MKFFLILMTLFASNFSYAQVLLIPSSDRAFEDYKKSCQKEGYICTPNFFLDQIQKQETPQFDQLIDELDYSSKDFRNSLSDRILKVLKSEMISVEQAEILLKLIEQMQAFAETTKIKNLQMIEKQLQENLRLIQNDHIKDLPAEFSIVLKKAVSSETGRKLKKDFLRMKNESIQFNRAISSTDFLIHGDCKNEVVHSNVQNVKWQLDRENACDFTEKISRASATTSNFISNNKTSLITIGIIAVGAALLSKNYEVQFSF